MKNKIIKTFITAAFAFAALFTATACSGDGGKSSPEENEVKDASFNYYQTAYGVSADNVFQTLTYRDFIDLLDPSNAVPAGEYAVLLGGAWDSATKGVIGDIDAKAKAHNVKHVYVLDVKLDGGYSEEIIKEYAAKSDAVITAADGKITDGDFAGKTGYKVDGKYALYDDLSVFDFATSITAENSVTLMEDAEKHLIGDIKTVNSATPNLLRIERTAYNHTASLKAQITPSAANLDAFFDGLKNEAPRFDSFTVRNHLTGLTENKYFYNVNYGELIALLETPGDHAVLLGGIWCGDTQKLFSAIHANAESVGYGKRIYMYDARLDGTTSNFAIRSNETTFADAAARNHAGTHAALYAYLMDKYFDALSQSRWNTADSVTRVQVNASAANATPYTVFGKAEYYKVCIPNLILFNKASQSKIIDSFEAELSTANPYSGGNLAERIDYAYGALSDLFIKVGLTEKFIAEGYAVKSEFTLNGTVYNAAKGVQYLTARSYYAEADFTANKAALSAYTYSVAGARTTYYGTAGGYLIAKDFFKALSGASGGVTGGGGENMGEQPTEDPCA